MNSPLIWFGSFAKFLRSAIKVPGSTSGMLTVQPAAVTTDYTITMPAVQGAASTTLENDGAGNLTWTAGGGMTNPMTTLGDTIYGGVAGAPTALPIGTAGQVLTVTAGVPAWVTSGAGTGDVVGPASSVDEGLARFDGTTGKLIQDSPFTLTDAGILRGATTTQTIAIETLPVSGGPTAAISITSGARTGASAGTSGNVSLSSGTSTRGSGTAILQSGTSDTIPSGAVTVTSGAVTGGGASGAVTVSSGSVTGAALSGDVNIITGAVGSGQAGDIFLSPGGSGSTRGSVNASLAKALTLPLQSADPTVGITDGDFYYNTATDRIRSYNGTAWTEYGSGSGDVVGPASATDNAIALFDGVTGKLISNSNVTINVSGLTGTSIVGTDAISFNFATPDSAGVTTPVSIYSGVSSGSSSGYANLSTGNANTTSGNISIISGDSTTADSGSVTVLTGDAATSAGAINLTTGDAAAADSSSNAINLTTGAGSGDFSGDIVLLTEGSTGPDNSGGPVSDRGRIKLRGRSVSFPENTVDPTGDGADIYFNSTNAVFRGYNGTSWVDLSGAAVSGDVVGPASAVDNAIAIYDGVTGKLIKNSTLEIGTLSAASLAPTSVTNFLRLGTQDRAGGVTANVIIRPGDVTSGTFAGGSVEIGSGGGNNASSGFVTIYTSDSTGTPDNTGFIQVITGTSSTGEAGFLQFVTGDSGGATGGGEITITTGTAVEDVTTATRIALLTGTAGTTSGDITLTTGDGTDASGNVLIYTGASAGTGTTGTVEIITGTSATGVAGSMTIATGDTGAATGGGAISMYTGTAVETSSSVTSFGLQTGAAGDTSGQITLLTNAGADGSGDIVLQTNGASDNRGQVIVQARSFRFPVSTTDPVVANSGDSYYNSVSDRLRLYNSATATWDEVSPDISARAYASATTITGTLATVVWTTEDYDTAAALSAGVFTAPVAGKYSVKAAIALSGTFVLNNTTVIEIQVNGTAISNVTEYVAGTVTEHSVSISDTLNLAATDTVQIQVSSSGTSPVIVTSNTRNYFAIIKEA